MLCLGDHQTMAFKDQSTIPKATFIEIDVYSGIIVALFLPPPYYHPLPARVQEKNVVYERDFFFHSVTGAWNKKSEYFSRESTLWPSGY